MFMKKRFPYITLLTVLTIPTVDALPYDEGAYLFGNYTRAQLKQDNSGNKGASNSAGLGAGYRFEEHFALEVGYKDLGDLSNSSTVIVKDPKNRYSILQDLEEDSHHYKARALVLRAIGIYPLTPALSLEGHLGAAFVRTESEYKNSVTNLVDNPNRIREGFTQESSRSETKTSIAPAIGAGATYAFNDNLRAFTRYEFIKLPKTNGVGADSHSIDIGLRYVF